jgi:3-hydroxymyristoyl/3-hydroxydecanoyl-(acyl carrier protein) dehydratase
MILFDFIIDNEHPSLSGHFPDNPIVPGAIIVEKVIQGLSELETPKEVITLITIKYSNLKLTKILTIILYKILYILILRTF